MKKNILFTLLLAFGLMAGSVPTVQAQMDVDFSSEDGSTTTKKKRTTKKKVTRKKTKTKSKTRDKVKSDSEDAAEEKDSASDDSPVLDAISKLDRVAGGRVNKDATHFIYLFSASWCGPCKALMPQIVKEYKKMKRADVELILMCADRTEDDAKAYARGYKATFPVFMSSDPKAAELPGFANPQGIPWAIMVDAEGKVIKNSHASFILEWENLVK